MFYAYTRLKYQVSINRTIGPLVYLGSICKQNMSLFPAAFFLALNYQETKLFVELPQTPDTPKFLNELKKARDCEYHIGLVKSFYACLSVSLQKLWTKLKGKIILIGSLTLLKLCKAEENAVIFRNSVNKALFWSKFQKRCTCRLNGN